MAQKEGKKENAKKRESFGSDSSVSDQTHSKFEAIEIA